MGGGREGGRQIHGRCQESRERGRREKWQGRGKVRGSVGRRREGGMQIQVSRVQGEGEKRKMAGRGKVRGRCGEGVTARRFRGGGQGEGDSGGIGGKNNRGEGKIRVAGNGINNSCPSGSYPRPVRRGRFRSCPRRGRHRRGRE